MADPKGFLNTPRQTPGRRPVDIRLTDWREVYTEFSHGDLERQAGRCMDCGIPFCHNGCPLGNLIPEWNDLVERHLAETGSAVASRLLADWDAAAGRFGKVMPKDYKRVLAAAQRAERDGLDVNEAVMTAASG